MSFKDTVNAALPVWFSEDFADTITYDGNEILAHISYANDGGTTAKHAVITVKAADIPDPQYRDPVVINGVTWRVIQDQSREAIIKGDGYTWDIPIIRDEKPRII